MSYGPYVGLNHFLDVFMDAAISCLCQLVNITNLNALHYSTFYAISKWLEKTKPNEANIFCNSFKPKDGLRLHRIMLELINLTCH